MTFRIVTQGLPCHPVQCPTNNGKVACDMTGAGICTPSLTAELRADGIDNDCDGWS
jgi:hypothetical protein